MKCRKKRLRTVLCAAAIVLGTVLAAAPRSVRAAGNQPAVNSTVYNTIKHFLTHVVKRDPYSFYSTIPCTGELRECIGYVLDAYQSQGVDLISRFNLHWSASYPYANVRNFCAQLDKQLTSGSTVKVPCGNSSFTFLFKKYKNADAAFADGAFNTAGTIGLLTSPTETYGHCWISLGMFWSSLTANNMRAWLESYYGLGANALSGTIATGDASKVWKGYGDRSVWRVHATRWSEGVHGGCIVDNGASGDALKNAPCYVLIPVSDNAQGAQQTQPSQPSQSTQPSQSAQPSQSTQPPQPAQPDKGTLSVKLVSAEPGLTGGNANYSLNGVKIGVYTDPACTRELLSSTTDANGSAKFNNLWVQTVYVKLKTDAPGYQTAAVRSAKITKDHTTELSFSLTPETCSANISVQPQVFEPSLDGTVFTVCYYACSGTDQLSNAVLKGVWTMTAGQSGAVFGEDTTAVLKAPDGTDGYYRDADGRIIFPLGIITVEQTGAARGQSLKGTWAVAGSTGSGSAANAAVSALDGSDAPVIYYTSAYGLLQSLISNGTTSYLVTVSPTGAAPDSLRTLCIVPSEKLNAGIWFMTGGAQSAEPLIDPIISCGLFTAGGNAKPEGALLQNGDIVRLYDKSDELCFEGSIFLCGDGSTALHINDLVRIRSSVSDRLQNGIYADDGGRMPDLFNIRSQLLGTAPVFLVP